MTNVTIGEQLQEDYKNNAKMLFENAGGFTRRNGGEFLANGSSVILLSSMADFPSLTNGLIQVEQEKSYRFIEPFTVTDQILFPAGWKGFIDASFLLSESVAFDGGVSSAFNTLNLDGTIDSIADAGSGFITVTSTAHGIFDGQYVNIIGTTSYNVQQLLVSNRTANTFDVELTFVADESGLFNTGYQNIAIRDIDVRVAGVTTSLLNLTGADSLTSLMTMKNVQPVGFQSPGTIRNSAGVQISNTLLSFITNGLTLDNIRTIGVKETKFVDDGAISASIALTLTGAFTTKAIIDNVDFVLSLADQRLIKIDTSIVNASLLSITNSSDNNVADEYFDESGLDQTDPQVFTKNNGLRADSTNQSESRSNGVLEVAGGIGTPIPIQDITPAPGDYILDSRTEGFSMDTSTGTVTYNGLAPITVLIGYSLEAAQTSGPAQNLVFDLRINNIQQSKTIKVMGTMGVGSFITIVSLGGLFTINPNDTFKLFKTNTTNTGNTDVQDTVLLIR